MCREPDTVITEYVAFKRFMNPTGVCNVYFTKTKTYWILMLSYTSVSRCVLVYNSLFVLCSYISSFKIGTLYDSSGVCFSEGTVGVMQ